MQSEAYKCPVEPGDMPAQIGVRFEENPVILSGQLLVSAIGKNCDMLPFLRRTE